jgi:hypothetical protein
LAARTLAVGVVLLLIGLIVGVAGVIYPASANSSQSYSLLPSTTFKVDPNDYQSHNVVLTRGSGVSYSLSLSSNTTGIFDLVIMNQSQYYNYYGCAPACHQPLLGGNGTFYQQAGEVTPDLLNNTVTPSAPVSGTFTAPTNGTYYFIFDNTVGNNWTQYTSASGNPAWVTFSLTAARPVTIYSTNWLFVGPGAILLIVGGAVGSMQGGKKAETQPAQKM